MSDDVRLSYQYVELQIRYQKPPSKMERNSYVYSYLYLTVYLGTLPSNLQPIHSLFHLVQYCPIIFHQLEY